MLLRRIPGLSLPAVAFLLVCGFRCDPDVPIGADDAGPGDAGPGALACAGDNPAGCTNDADCAPAQTCSGSGRPSACACDPVTGTWSCTADLSGGECVAAMTCPGQNPAGCLSDSDCASGNTCVPAGRPSSCTCDPATGTWICTRDTSGGDCVPTTGGCSGPNPAGCTSHSACGAGLRCEPSGRPSACTCEPALGTWSCTPDTSGGDCVATGCVDASAPGVTYYGESPDECARITFGCGAGEVAFGGDCGCGCQPASAANCGTEICDYASQYCEAFTGGVPGSRTVYTCRPLPATCSGVISCAACFPGDSFCEMRPEGLRYNIAAP